VFEVDLGTRALIFPQPTYVRGYERPERVWLSPAAGSVRPGPSDDLLEVVRPRYPKDPYAFPNLPPFRGHTLPPVEPDASGHLDFVAPGSPGFTAVHAYACTRRVVDIWQSYLRATIPWHFRSHLPRLEIIPELQWRNAQSGFGFLELGGETDDGGRFLPYALNFDVIAHEVGHLVLFGLMGVPRDWHRVPAFGSFHEAFADLTALLGLLHFDTAVDRLLRRTQAELWLRNELNRIGELMDERQIRVASHSYRVGDGSDTVHDRSRPVTGALFDWLVDIYVDRLGDQGVIEGSLIRRLHADSPFDDDLVDAAEGTFMQAFRIAPFAFRAALQDARDVLGGTLAAAVGRLDPETLSFADVAEALLTSAEVGRATSVDRLEECLAWRGLLSPRTRPAQARPRDVRPLQSRQPERGAPI